MARNSASAKRFAAHYYRYDLLDWRRRVLDLSVRQLAKRLKMREGTAHEVFAGKASGKMVYPIAKFLRVDWMQVHNLELQESEFHLAVVSRNGNGSSAAVK